jgi:hypothetical protein
VFVLSNILGAYDSIAVLIYTENMACSFFQQMNRFKFFFMCGILMLFSNTFQVFSQTSNAPVLRIEIADQNNSLISNANVKLVFGSNEESICVNDNQGVFNCVVLSAEDFTLEVRAEGFSILRQKIVFSQDFAEKEVYAFACEFK